MSANWATRAAVKDCSLWLLVGVGRQSIDALRDLVRLLRIGELHFVPADVAAAAELSRLVEVVPVEEQDVLLPFELLVLGVKDTDQVEGPRVGAVLLREDGRFQGNLVTDLPIEALREARTDDRAGARAFERLALLRRHHPLGKKFLRSW
jgi:hypothetical protein